jgi:hypothetical protein
MTVTYSTLYSRVLRTLDDVDANLHSDDLIYDALIGAHDAIVQWVPRFSEATLTSGSNGALYAIPEDCYQVDVVQVVSDGMVLPKAIFEASKSHGFGMDEASDWIESPSGFINLGVEIEGGITVYYRSYWPAPADKTDVNFVITPPRSCHLGMVYYACAHALLPRAVSTGGIRQFGTEIDSGKPTDNPLQVMSNVFLQRFVQEMKLQPSYVKVGY